jgi:vacuolar-type H+-ATPase subunit F/Vma7
MVLMDSLNQFLSYEIALGVNVGRLLLSISIILIGFLLAKLFSRRLKSVRNSLGLIDNSSFSSERLIGLLVLTVSLFLALVILGTPVFGASWIGISDILSRIFIVLLITTIGSIIVVIFANLMRDFILKAGDKHLQEYQLSPRLIGFIFGFIKLFISLIILSAAMNYAELSFMVFDILLVSSVIIFMSLLAFIVGYAFKDYAANLIISPYVSKHVVRIGQTIQLGGKIGQVTQITGHATYVAFDSGYSIMIPNSAIMKKALIIKRATSDIQKLEPLISKHTVALPSKSSGASLSMMLSFFGHDIESRKVFDELKKSEGNEITAMIDTAKALTNNDIQGSFIEWNSKYDIRSEIQSWLTQEALVIVCIPSTHNDEKEKEKRYVLVVGIEEDEVVILDPVMRTRGTYLVNANKLQKYLEKEKTGYVVFAKKKTAAAWRINEGLYYGEISAYQSISKAFERYLRQSMRESRVVNSFISPHVSSKTSPEKKDKPEWKPNLSNHKENEKK